MKKALPLVLGIFATSAQAQVNLPCFTDFDFVSSSLVPDTVCLGLPIQFMDQSSSPGGPMNIWVWDMGEGTQYFDQNPTHLYGSTGTYQVTLNASDGAGCSGQMQRQVTVVDRAQVYVAPAMTSCVGLCDASTSLVVTSALPGQTLSIAWGDPLAQAGFDVWSLCAGLYDFTVSDVYGCSVTYTEALVVTDPVPVLAEIGTASVLTGCDQDVLSLEGYGYGGDGYYTYEWIQVNGCCDFSDNGVQFPSYFLNTTNSGEIKLVVHDGNFCYDTAMAYIDYYPSQLTGTVTMAGTGQPCVNCPVQLYQWDNYGFWLNQADGLLTDANGQYSTTVQAYRQYIIRVLPDFGVNPNSCATYSGDVHDFDIAQQIDSDCGNNIVTDIQVITWPTNSGLCTLTGTVYGGSFMLGELVGKVAEEDPIPLIDVVVEKIPPGGSFIMGHDITDINGVYTFSFMPETGTDEYVIHVDIPGVPQTTSYNITVGQGDVLFAGLDFCVADGTGVSPVGTDTCSVLVTHVNTGTAELGLTLGPNPTLGSVRAELSGASPTQPAMVTVHDATGRVVFNTSMRADAISFDLSGEAPGLYSVNVEQDGRKAFARVALQ
jgi:PKD repeat protein